MEGLGGKGGERVNKGKSMDVKMDVIVGMDENRAVGMDEDRAVGMYENTAVGTDENETVCMDEDTTMSTDANMTASLLSGSAANESRKGVGRRLGELLGGSFLLGMGVGICNVAGWGMDPLAVFADGAAKASALSFSISNYLIYVLLAAAAWGLDRRQVTLWSFVCPFATSLGIEAVMRMLPRMGLSAISLVCYLIGIAFMSLGIAFTIRADMGKSPYDAFIFAVMPRVGRGYAVIRWGMDAVWLVAGALLGGVWGVGTVLALVLIGKMTEGFGRLLRRRCCGRIVNAGDNCGG